MAFVVKSSVLKASKSLASTVLRLAGGSSAIANSLGTNRQGVHKYIKLGYVPLKSVYDVSKLIDVDPWVISYHKLAEVFGERSPALEKVIRSSPLPTAEKENILKLLK